MEREKITIEEWIKWTTELSRLDFTNYQVLIDLPNALQVIAEMPEGRYRSMAIFGVAAQEVGDEYLLQELKEQSDG